MARLTSEQAENFSKGGGSFFKIEDGQKKRVRFLYNTVNDMEYFSAHEYSGDNFATIDCARTTKDEPIDMCKWCALGNVPVGRIVLPIYEIETGEITYWKKPSKWTKENLEEGFKLLPAGMPISGQTYVISRKGKGLETKYTVQPDLSTPNDGKAKETFGEIRDPWEMNMIKPNDCDFDPNATSNNSPTASATRRTTEVF